MREPESVRSRWQEPHRGSLRTRAPLIGIIGPIGCGKSTVAARLAGLGAAVVDADELTRRLMAPGAPVTAAVFARFGGEFRLPDGSLDRVALGRFVFADQERLAALEAIVHPAVVHLEREAIRAADARRPRAIILEAVKLVEAGHAPWCDEIWLVVCDSETQLARLVGRGMDAADARQRVAAQASSLATWRSAASRTIRTDGSRDEVDAVVQEAFEDTLARARAVVDSEDAG